jgi:hypothetical protein
MADERQHDRSLIFELVVVSLLVVALASRNKRPSPPVPAIHEAQTTPSTANNYRSPQDDRPDDIAGFRLLVTILAGVALGAAASALPTLMANSATGELLFAIWLMWTTGVVAVILVYLSTLTGSKVIPNEIDLAHTAALIGSFLAQCGLFASLVRTNVYESVRWWFISFSSFGVAATAAILLGLWILPKSRREMDREVLAIYRRGQWGDALMASLTAVLPVLYLVLVPERSDRGVLIAATIALAGMIAACLKQSLERRKLRRGGLI